jgi:hypothetical protein
MLVPHHQTHPTNQGKTMTSDTAIYDQIKHTHIISCITCGKTNQASHWTPKHHQTTNGQTTVIHMAIACPHCCDTIKQGTQTLT